MLGRREHEEKKREKRKEEKRKNVCLHVCVVVWPIQAEDKCVKDNGLAAIGH